MNLNKPDQQNLLEFLSDAGDPFASPSRVPPFIEKELVVSRKRLFFVYFLGSILGYTLSLAICAQYGLGLSSLSWKLAQYLHSIPDPWCPIVCGVVFGISPTLVSTLYLSRFQHRFLIFRMGWLPALVPVLGTVTLLLFGDSRSWEWRCIWLASAVATPYVIELASAVYLRQRQWIKSRT